jgi:hypothetical protein
MATHVSVNLTLTAAQKTALDNANNGLVPILASAALQRWISLPRTAQDQVIGSGLCPRLTRLVLACEQVARKPQ